MRASTCRASARPRSCSAAPAARRPARSPSCAVPTPRRAPSSPVAPPVARPRWSSSTSTTPTSSSSSRPRRSEEEKIRVLRDAGFDMDLGGDDITSVQYQNANNSVRVNDEFMRAVEEGTEFGLRGRTTGEVIESIDAARAVGQDGAGRVGVRRPGHPVRLHHQRLAHHAGDRTHHRVQPVQRVHAPRQLQLQPGQPQPAEVPAGRRLVRRPEVRQGDRADHHRDGHLASASPTSRPRRSARPRGRTASSASATPTSARC